MRRNAPGCGDLSEIPPIFPGVSPGSWKWDLSRETPHPARTARARATKGASRSNSR
jgi:hypothetical protein